MTVSRRTDAHDTPRPDDGLFCACGRIAAADDGLCALCWFDNPTAASKGSALIWVACERIESACDENALQRVAGWIAGRQWSERELTLLRGLWRAQKAMLEREARMAAAPLWPVIVIDDRSVPAHPKPGSAHVIDMADAMTREWSTDACVVQYQSDIGRRVSTASVGHAAIRMTSFIIDVDAPNKQRTEDWNTQLVERARKLPDRPWGYFTRSGARFVWRLPQPLEIRSSDDTAQWAGLYERSLIHVAMTSGILCDPACSDFSRIFRVPHGTRDGVLQVHGDVCGDLRNIGAWSFDGKVDWSLDVRANEAARRLSLSRTAQTRVFGSTPALRPTPRAVFTRPETDPACRVCAVCGQGFRPPMPHYQRCGSCVRLHAIVERLSRAGLGSRNATLTQAAVAVRRLAETQSDDGSRLHPVRGLAALRDAGQQLGLPDVEVLDVLRRMGPRHE